MGSQKEQHTGFPVTEKELMKDIELHWEKYRGTNEGKQVTELGFFTTIALYFTKYYVQQKLKK